MTLPKYATVNGVRYAVDRVPGRRIEGNLGECRTDETRILIARELSSEAATATYLHEVGHASFYESGAHELARAVVADVHGLEELLVQVWLPVYRHSIGFTSQACDRRRHK